MDLYQWRTQNESDHNHNQNQHTPAKMPKLLLNPHEQQPPPEHQHHLSGSVALPLFVSEPNTTKFSNLSAFPDSTTTTTSPANPRFPTRMSYFSMAQWQELELQALIYRYILAGSAVPLELLNSIKKTLHSQPIFLHHPLHQHFSPYQPALLQAGYWGRAAMDPEPGRCRRTDGKKWRCSRDVVPGHKYCERHIHRGRNRSRKPVETTTSVGGAGGGSSSFNSNNAVTIAETPFGTAANGNSFSLSGKLPSIDLLQLNCSSSDSRIQNKGLHGQHHSGIENRSDGHILRQFFDDWPRSLQEPDETGSNSNITSSMNSATCLSISMPGNLSSDVSLKLSTGDGEESGNNVRDQHQLNWSSGWGSTHGVASMGGPLAEALRSSSTSSFSPSSVLHQLPRRLASETSFVTT